MRSLAHEHIRIVSTRLVVDRRLPVWVGLLIALTTSVLLWMALGWAVFAVAGLFGLRVS